MSPGELHQRIVEIREELEYLAQQVHEQTRDGEDDSPDTDAILEIKYAFGDRVGRRVLNSSALSKP